jgi:hypothetical protein
LWEPSTSSWRTASDTSSIWLPMEGIVERVLYVGSGGEINVSR